MRVILAKNVAQFIKREASYLDSFNPRAAARVVESLQAAFRLLGEHPKIGKPLSLPGRRRFVSGVYVIDYSLERTRVVISHIRHGQQVDPMLSRDRDVAAEGEHDD
ncbi:type II toxin-antitoxin system RelE/ParE family toxin [Rhizobium sp. SAFR-030]|uniref:type II toxin-antitoxin system RelE/ParE family toxin n=1 Tax=Rhizobium sp. SAFR-030 TaxID=3387277 RepID=UPI003F80977C